LIEFLVLCFLMSLFSSTIFTIMIHPSGSKTALSDFPVYSAGKTSMEFVDRYCGGCVSFVLEPIVGAPVFSPKDDDGKAEKTEKTKEKKDEVKRKKTKQDDHREVSTKTEENLNSQIPEFAPSRLPNVFPIPAPHPNPHVSDSVVSDPSLELSMRLASVKSVEDLGEYFQGNQYEFNVQHSAEQLYNWNTWGRDATLEDYILPSIPPVQGDHKLPTLSSIESPRPKTTASSRGILPPEHHYHQFNSWNEEDERRDYDQERINAIGYVSVCVTCKRVDSDYQFDTNVDKRFTGISKPTKKNKKVSADTRSRLWWNGEETLHNLPATAVLPQIPNEAASDDLSSFTPAVKPISMMAIKSLHVYSDDSPFVATPNDWHGLYRRKGDSSDVDFTSLPDLSGEFESEIDPNDLPYAYISSPARGSVVGDATVRVGSENFFPSTTTGRLHLILDESQYIPILTPSAEVRFTNLSPGLHNFTLQLFLRSDSTAPFFSSVPLIFQYNPSQKEGVFPAPPISFSDLLPSRSAASPPVVPELTLLSADSPCNRCRVNYLFDFLCEGVHCGVWWKDVKDRLRIDTYLNSTLFSSSKPAVGVFGSVDLEMTGGDWDVSLIVSFKQEDSTIVPIAGASTMIRHINLTQSLRLGDLGAKVSGEGIDSLRGIQRSLSRETRHGFITRGMHIFSPEGGGVLEERFTKGGSSIHVLYDIPFLNFQFHFQNFASYAVASTPPLKVQLILTIPENSTCPTDQAATAVENVGKKGKSKKTKGPPNGIKMDACGGYYGELALPLTSPMARVSLRNLGSGVHYLRFRLLNANDAPVLVSPAVTSSKSLDTIGSLSFNFVNGTRRGEWFSMTWENNDITTELWNIVQNGSVKDLELLSAHNPDAIHSRSNDGRGPLWWAYEYGREDIVEYLLDEGVAEMAADKEGFVGKDMAELYHKFHKKD